MKVMVPVVWVCDFKTISVLLCFFNLVGNWKPKGKSRSEQWCREDDGDKGKETWANGFSGIGKERNNEVQSNVPIDSQ